MPLLRREFLACGAIPIAMWAGCSSSPPPQGRVEKVWGRRGISDGRLYKPRAVTIDPEDRLYIVDMSGRIQVFDRDGEFQSGWRTPLVKQGKPCGLTYVEDDRILVADTHYFRMLVYGRDGSLMEQHTIGGTHGTGPGEFGFVTDAVVDSHGNYYIGEYGEFDRIQKFAPDGRFLYQWGQHGHEPGDFLRPQALVMDDDDHLWVADACNHRLQVFDVSGDKPELVDVWGRQGRELGEFRYPYGIVLDDRGFVYVCEFGNHRVQKFTRAGETVGAFGTAGRREGELHQPWGIVQDSSKRLHVLDTYNHRVQRVYL